MSIRSLYPNFSFSFTPTSTSSARLGKLTTPHGSVNTPNFIFCATKASIKSVPTHELKALGTEIILANTYHLMISPGADLIEKMGGLHRFMNYDGVLLTDSGGYQIFSMGHGSVSAEIKKTQNRSHRTTKSSLLKISERGATFRSYRDGHKIFLSPEKAINTQKKLGADLIVQLDECTPANVDKNYTKKSMEMSLRWGKRSLTEFKKINDEHQALYRVIQGGIYLDLRKISIEAGGEDPFFGIALGGSLGRTKEEMYEVIDYCQEKLASPVEPIHLLGIGDVKDIFYGVRRGIDTFDCVRPTRIARHGCALVPASINPAGFINLKNQAYLNDPNPLDEGSADFPICNYSKGYLHHLFRVKEMSAITILTQYNVLQMNRLFRQISETLKSNTFNHCEKYWCG